MTQQELRELDAWIAERVMGWQIGDEHFIDPKGNYIDCEFLTEDAVESVIPRYSCCQYDAMDVLKKCAEKLCSQKVEASLDENNAIMIEVQNGKWNVTPFAGRYTPTDSKTLELAICLFAKQLFSQTTK